MSCKKLIWPPQEYSEEEGDIESGEDEDYVDHEGDTPQECAQQ